MGLRVSSFSNFVGAFLLARALRPTGEGGLLSRLCHSYRMCKHFPPAWFRREEVHGLHRPEYISFGVRVGRAETGGSVEPP